MPAAAGAGAPYDKRADVAEPRSVPSLSEPIGGWRCGGHAGIGSSMHGAVWDDIVAEMRVVTVEEEPRTLTLRGEEVRPLLHTFGAVGICSDVTMRTVARHEWLEAVSFHPTFA
jgi:FAD/FMN-containing dehydrogenase